MAGSRDSAPKMMLIVGQVTGEGCRGVLGTAGGSRDGRSRVDRTDAAAEPQGDAQRRGGGVSAHRVGVGAAGTAGSDAARHLGPDRGGADAARGGTGGGGRTRTHTDQPVNRTV